MSPPTKSTASIDDLPPEMISELFEHLPPKDLAACSLVNKRWHLIYSAFKLQWLVVIDFNRNFEHCMWYHSNRRIEEEDRCRLAVFHRLVAKPLLSNLKHLVLVDPFNFDLNKLNRFEKLVHLEIEVTIIYKKVHLNLPRLKVLAFHHLNRGCSLSIDCPLLSTLLYRVKIENVDSLELKHPEMIRKLETDLVGPDLAKFKNVECLVTRKFEAISKTTLILLPKLRELRYIGNILFTLKRTLSEFLDEAKKLRGDDFRFRFAGLQLTNANVEQIDFDGQVDGVEYKRVHKECVYMKNYQLIEPGAIDFVHEIDYTRLLSHVTGEFPRCFSQKFIGVNSVEAKGAIENPDHFLWFLKSLRFLSSLILEDTKLGQAFYDQLPALACSLGGLYLRNGHCENGLQVNFDFIGKFSCLSHLVISPKLWSPESVTSLVRWLGKLKNCEFSFSTRRR